MKQNRWEDAEISHSPICPQSSGKVAARFAIVLAMVIWGTAIVITKIVVVETGPLLVAAVRLAIAAAVFTPFSLRRVKIKTLPLAPLALSGFFGITLYSVLLNFGLLSTSAAAAGLIQGAAPIFTVILSVLFLREKMSVPRLVGVLSSVAGVSLIVLNSTSGRAEPFSLIGILLVVGSTLVWALYIVTSKSLAERCPQQVIAAGQIIFGFLFLLPLALAEGICCGFGEITPKNLLFIVYLALASSGAAYYLWNYSLRRLSAIEAGAFANLCPLVTFVTAVIVLQETVTTAVLAGGALVIAGLYLAGLSGKAARARKENAPGA